MRRIDIPVHMVTRLEGEGKTRFLTVLFCAFIGVILVLFLVLPKENFSDVERRYLEKPPEFSAKTVFDGTFEENAEDYISDHFPLRRFWIGLNSYASLCMGRPLIHDVYVGRDGYYMQAPAESDAESLAFNLSAVLSFAEQAGAPAAVLGVPETGYIMEDELPAVHLPYEDEKIIQAAREQLQDKAVWIEIAPVLQAARQMGQLYYRTDHHWTTLGAYAAYRQICEQLNLQPLEQSAFSVERYGGFLGTTYAKVLLWNPDPDSIELWQYPIACKVETLDAENNMKPAVMNSFYDMEALRSYDPYTVFFGGNHSLMRITNQDANAQGRLLVVKDSFANSLLPFLANHYKEIVVVDPRYFTGSMQLLENEPQFDQILFVYGLGNLMKDENLGLITRQALGA